MEEINIRVIGKIQFDKIYSVDNTPSFVGTANRVERYFVNVLYITDEMMKFRDLLKLTPENAKKMAKNLIALVDKETDSFYCPSGWVVIPDVDVKFTRDIYLDNFRVMIHYHPKRYSSDCLPMKAPNSLYNDAIVLGDSNAFRQFINKIVISANYAEVMQS